MQLKWINKKKVMLHTLNFKYYYLKIYIYQAVKLCDKYEFT